MVIAGRVELGCDRGNANIYNYRNGKKVFVHVSFEGIRHISRLLMIHNRWGKKNKKNKKAFGCSKFGSLNQRKM